MKQSKNFFITIAKTFYLGNYKKFAQNQSQEIWKYFFSIVFVGLLILVIFGIPLIAKIPNYVEKKLSNFNEFDLNPKIKLNEKINIPSKKPIVVFSPEDNATIGKELFLITSNKIETRFLWQKDTFTFEKFSNIKKNANFYGFVSGFIFIMMLPMILLLAYIFFTVKFLLIILITTIIIFLITHFTHLEVKFREIFAIGVYSSTILIIPNMIFTSLRFHIYHLEYLAFFIYFVLGVMVSARLSNRNKNKIIDESGYITLK